MSNIAVVKFIGEVSPELDAREDLEAAVGGCRQMQNMIPDKFGNAVRRPGTELIQVSNGAGCYYLPVIPDPTKIQITTPQELQDMQNDLTEDYELINNIDMTGFDFTPIAQGSTFNGTLDGRYFTISNLKVSNFGNTNGLFSSTGASAIIENVIIDNIIATGLTHANTGFGGIVGSSSDSTIINCYVSGTISGFDAGAPLDSIGGIVGQSTTSTFTKCGSNVSITGTGFKLSTSGLFMGVGNGTFTDCYGQGSLSGLGGGANKLLQTGGFAGRLLTGSSITNCYVACVQTGSIQQEVGGFLGQDEESNGVYSNNFWDGTIEMNGLDDIGDLGNVADITESTTTNMHKEATYTNWDFDDIWAIDEGNDYPRFQWQKQADIKRVCYPL